MGSSKISSIHGELSDIECEDCGDLIPLKRTKLVKVPVCVSCMMDREDRGEGTKRHTMNYHVTTKGDDIESIETSIVRAKE